MYRVSSRDSTHAFTTGMFAASALKPLGADDYLLLCHLTLAPILGLAGGVVARTFAGRPHELEPTRRGEASFDSTSK
jgi:hypothetical protein